MQTPVFDFVRSYADSDPIRMHMPGHKGTGALGCEALDITEIGGADELFAPSGILAQSEANASALFQCRTLYSAEGSSLCMRAMLRLLMQYAAEQGRPAAVLAARNVHKTYLAAAAVLGFETLWLPPSESYLTAEITQDVLGKALQSCRVRPAALWLTSPDYLGNMADIRAAASFCRAHDMLLLVDGAHGAYLKFLPEDQHPIALGADLCCDSAHKTLPVLTGGAYLHLADSAPELFRTQAKQAMALFASTSPSWLILASLDRCNALLAAEYPEKLRALLPRLEAVRGRLRAAGWTICGEEPMKLTLCPKSRGYTGEMLASILQKERIYAEFADTDNLVLMPSPYLPDSALTRTADLLCALPPLPPVTAIPPAVPQPVFAVSPQKAMSAPSERLPLRACIGRVCAELPVSCPPAVPAVMCGEVITEEAAQFLTYYDCDSCTVMRNNIPKQEQYSLL